NPYFSDLSPQILAEVILGMRLYCFERREIVFWEGDENPGLHVIRKGSVKLFKISPRGRELVIRVVDEGATFNEVPVFDHQPNPVNVSAVEESELWVIESDLLRSCIAQYPELAQSVIHNLCVNLRMLLGTVEELSFYQVTNRLARLINKLPAEQLQGSKEGRLTQDDLAARLGTVREVVARSLKELERSGAIDVNRGQIRVVDDERLVEWT
ncbi:MAG: Crp/Fnr family transcriptional regulator, partial [Anaerolineales bacterium]|nr:Crp/Fnr family transcriptional regulator [Anaerolineales bacterium]